MVGWLGDYSGPRGYLIKTAVNDETNQWKMAENKKYAYSTKRLNSDIWTTVLCFYLNNYMMYIKVQGSAMRAYICVSAWGSVQNARNSHLCSPCVSGV